MLALVERIAILGRRGVLEHGAEALEHSGSGTQFAALYTIQRLFPATLPGLALGLDLAPPLRRESRDHNPPVGLRASPFDVAGVGEMVEHLGDRSRRHARRNRQLPSRQLAALVELDQQL